MESDHKPTLVALRRRRDQVIEALSDRFAGDVLGLDEFEERLDLAHRARSLEELEHIVSDLEPASEEAPVPPDEPTPETALALPRPELKSTFTMMGGVERKGEWRPARRNRVWTIMGGTDLDFREVELPPGVTEVEVRAIMGGIDVIVPPNLAVECEGFAIMGGFDDLNRAPAHLDPERPLLRIKGFAIMGAFSIETRLPGESGWQAWKRRRRERAAARDRAIRERAENERLGDGR